MRRILGPALLACVLNGCAEPAQQAPPAPEPAPRPKPEYLGVDEVKAMLHSATRFCGLDRTEAAEAALLEVAERAFPAYEAILADRDSELLYVGQTCNFLSQIQTERRQFVPLALRRLTEPDAMVSPTAVLHATLLENRYRWFSDRTDIGFLEIALACRQSAAELRGKSRRSAMWLLSAIGDERETTAILPFLSDGMANTRYTAADTLAKIGGQRDLDALNACLKGNDPRRDANEMQYFKKRRDELEARMKAHPVPKYLMN
jgi:HEAT repeat protein